MNCCLCLSETNEIEKCILCKRVFCFECIEEEKKENQYIFNKNDVCIYCRIKDKYLIKNLF